MRDREATGAIPGRQQQQRLIPVVDMITTYILGLVM
jgi:hypothetical protein